MLYINCPSDLWELSFLHSIAEMICGKNNLKEQMFILAYFRRVRPQWFSSPAQSCTAWAHSWETALCAHFPPSVSSLCPSLSPSWPLFAVMNSTFLAYRLSHWTSVVLLWLFGLYLKMSPQSYVLKIFQKGTRSWGLWPDQWTTPLLGRNMAGATNWWMSPWGPHTLPTLFPLISASWLQCA